MKAPLLADIALLEPVGQYIYQGRFSCSVCIWCFTINAVSSVATKSQLLESATEPESFFC